MEFVVVINKHMPEHPLSFHETDNDAWIAIKELEVYGGPNYTLTHWPLIKCLNYVCKSLQSMDFRVGQCVKELKRGH